MTLAYEAGSPSLSSVQVWNVSHCTFMSSVCFFRVALSYSSKCIGPLQLYLASFCCIFYIDNDWKETSCFSFNQVFCLNNVIVVTLSCCALKWPCSNPVFTFNVTCFHFLPAWLTNCLTYLPVDCDWLVK